MFIIQIYVTGVSMKSSVFFSPQKCFHFFSKATLACRFSAGCISPVSGEWSSKWTVGAARPAMCYLIGV